LGLFLLSGSILTGCVTTERLEAGAETTLDSLTVAEAQQAVPSTPQTVRWGGTIAKVTNTASDTTQVEIVSRPLYRSGRPVVDDRSDGRFIAEFNEFLDPEIYTLGRALSVIGIVSDSVDGTVGESTYRFPRVQVSDFRYWKPRPPQREFPHSTLYDHYHNDPFWHDHYHHGGLHGRIIVTP